MIAVMRYALIRSVFTDSIPARACLALLLLFGVTLSASAYAPGSTPWLGVSVDALSFDELKRLDLDHGLKVTEVAQASPAAAAGVQVGDLLLALDGRPLYSVGRLQWLVHSYQPGDELPLLYQRDGTQQSTQVVLGSWQERARRHYGGYDSGSYLGVLLQPLSDGLRDYFGVSGTAGMLIAEVVKESPAASAGLKEGDVIVRMDRKAIRNMADVRRVLNYFDAEDEIEIELIRDREPLTLKVKLGQGRGHQPPVMPPHHGYGPGAMPHGYGPPPFSHPSFMPPIPDRS